MAVRNKKKMAVLMDLMSNDGRSQKRGAAKLLAESKRDSDIDTKSTRLPDINTLPNMMESGTAEVDTGLPESTAMDRMDINSIQMVRKSIDMSNDSLSETFLSHEFRSRLGARNHSLSSQKMNNKYTSSSQLGTGQRNHMNQHIRIRFGQQTPKGKRNNKQTVPADRSQPARK